MHAWLPDWLAGWLAGWMDACIQLSVCTRDHCLPHFFVTRVSVSMLRTDGPTDRQADRHQTGRTGRQADRQRHRQTQTETDRDRQRQTQTQTDRDRRRQTETDRDRQRRTERDRQIDGCSYACVFDCRYRYRCLQLFLELFAHMRV